MQTNPSPVPQGGGNDNSSAPPRAAQRIGVPKETFPLEKRVATVPEVVEKLIKLGFSVVVIDSPEAAEHFAKSGGGADAYS